MEACPACRAEAEIRQHFGEAIDLSDLNAGEVTVIEL